MSCIPLTCKSWLCVGESPLDTWRSAEPAARPGEGGGLGAHCQEPALCRPRTQALPAFRPSPGASVWLGTPALVLQQLRRGCGAPAFWTVSSGVRRWSGAPSLLVPLARTTAEPGRTRPRSVGSLTRAVGSPSELVQVALMGAAGLAPSSAQRGGNETSGP